MSGRKMWLSKGVFIKIIRFNTYIELDQVMVHEGGEFGSQCTIFSLFPFPFPFSRKFKIREWLGQLVSKWKD